jgi:hypothetical protein
MRKVALLVAVAFAVSAPSLAFAAKKVHHHHHHRHHVAAADNQSPEYLNRDSIKAFHDFFIWPSDK